MIASLPMYWRDENDEAWMRFWEHVRQACIVDLPPLTPPEALKGDWCDHWLAPGLVLSMTCGLPLRTRLKDKVRYVGTLDFGLDGSPGHYHSHIVQRSGLPKEADGIRLAYNEPLSQSGWAAAAEIDRTIGHWIGTGSHAGSLQALLDGAADIACIDAVTWRLLERSDAGTQRVDLIGFTRPTPGLPLICALDRDPAPLREALRQAVEATGPEDRAAMGGVEDFVVIDEALYHAVPVPPQPPA